MKPYADYVNEFRIVEKKQDSENLFVVLKIDADASPLIKLFDATKTIFNKNFAYIIIPNKQHFVGNTATALDSATKLANAYNKQISQYLNSNVEYSFEVWNCVDNFNPQLPSNKVVYTTA